MKSVGTFSLVLHTHLPWVAHNGTWPVGEEWLHQAFTGSWRRVLRINNCPPPTLGCRPCFSEFSTSGWRIMLGTTMSRVSTAMSFFTERLGPKRTHSMSRYSSIASSSSHSVTK